MLYMTIYNENQSKIAAKHSLQQHGAKANLFLYEGKTHTDLFLQVVIVQHCLDLLYFLVQ